MIVKAVIVVLALLTVYFFLIAAIDYVDKDQCLDKGGGIYYRQKMHHLSTAKDTFDKRMNKR